MLLHDPEHVENGWQQLELMTSLNGITTGEIEIFRFLFSHLLHQIDENTSQKAKKGGKGLQAASSGAEKFPENICSLPFMLEVLFACDTKNKDTMDDFCHREDVSHAKVPLDAPQRRLKRMQFLKANNLLETRPGGLSLPRPADDGCVNYIGKYFCCYWSSWSVHDYRYGVLIITCCSECCAASPSMQRL
jgi:hypothetical protein